MLTDSENAWLADREKDRHFVCRFCPGKEYGREMPDTGGVPCVCHCMSLHITPECYKLHKGTGWEDAALFEARVAAKLATYATMMVGSDIVAPCLECPCQKAGVCYHGTNKSCQWSFLTTARFAVEEEMDADRK